MKNYPAFPDTNLNFGELRHQHIIHQQNVNEQNEMELVPNVLVLKKKTGKLS